MGGEGGEFGNVLGEVKVFKAFSGHTCSLLLSKLESNSQAIDWKNGTSLEHLSWTDDER